MSGFDCHLSYEAIEGALLVSKVQSGKCDTTANAAFIAGPMPLGAGTSTAVSDTVTVSGLTQHNLSWKNTGNTKVYPYCIRADVLDLMSMESVASKKVEIEASISYKQDGEFATPTGFSIVEANETVAESSATKKVFVMAKGGLCNVTNSTPPGGNYLTICVYLEGASDAAMDDLSKYYHTLLLNDLLHEILLFSLIPTSSICNYFQNKLLFSQMAKKSMCLSIMGI